MKSPCLISLMMVWAACMPGSSYAVRSSPDSLTRLWKGGAFQAAEKPSAFVILMSPFALLRVNSARDLVSSQESVSRATYRGSSPKLRAQNDSAMHQSGGKASDERRNRGRASRTNRPTRRTALTMANQPQRVPNSRQRSIPGNALHQPGSDKSGNAPRSGLIPGGTVNIAGASRTPSVGRPAASSLNNARHRSPNPAVVGGSPNVHSSNTGAIDGTRMNRKR